MDMGNAREFTRVLACILAPTSDGETNTRTNYFRSHKQSRDLKGEFKLFASFTRARGTLSVSLAHSPSPTIFAFHPWSTSPLI